MREGLFCMGGYRKHILGPLHQIGLIMKQNLLNKMWSLIMDDITGQHFKPYLYGSYVCEQSSAGLKENTDTAVLLWFRALCGKLYITVIRTKSVAQ